MWRVIAESAALEMCKKNKKQNQTPHASQGEMSSVSPRLTLRFSFIEFIKAEIIKPHFPHRLIYTIHFMHCLYKMIDPMKNLINPQNRISMSLICQSQFPIWCQRIGNWLSGQSESPLRGITEAHLDVKPRTNIVWVHKVSFHFIVKAAWVFVFRCHHLSKHFVFVPLLHQFWGKITFFHHSFYLPVDVSFNLACFHLPSSFISFYVICFDDGMRD